MRGPLTAVLALVVLFAPRASRPQAHGDPGGPRPAPSRGGWELAPFSVENDARKVRLALTGYVQGDLRGYPGWTAQDEEGASLRAPTAEWQRVRLGLEGRWRALELRLETGPSRTPGERLKDAWISLRLADGLRARAGRQKLPGSAEWLTSNARTDLMERAITVDALCPGREIGLQLFAERGRFAGQAGVFSGDDSPGERNAGRTLAGRLSFRPRPWLDLGASGSHGRVTEGRLDTATAPSPRGFSVEASTGFPVHAPLFVAGPRQRLGADATLRLGSFGAHAEYLRQREDRRGQGPLLENLPAAVGRGFALASTWLVTGEQKTGTIRPRRPLPRGPGALELAVRWEAVDADDVADDGFEATGSRARNVRPAGLRSAQLGVSWWPVSLVRLMANAAVERYTDALRAPEPPRAGPYVSLLARVQVSLP